MLQPAPASAAGRPDRLDPSEAYHRAHSSPAGVRLDRHGLAMVHPIVRAALPDADPQYVSDIELIHGYVVRGAIARFADGEIAVTDILPILERALVLLTTDNRAELARSRPGTVDGAPPSTGKRRATSVSHRPA